LIFVEKSCVPYIQKCLPYRETSSCTKYGSLTLVSFLVGWLSNDGKLLVHYWLLTWRTCH